MTSLREQAVEAAAKAMWPDLFSDDPHVAHMAASPRMVQSARRDARKSATAAFNAILEVLEKPSLDVKMAGAEAITADHMKAMANYDAATDCLSAMIRAIREGK